MKIWVLFSEIGMNGGVVHGIYDHEPPQSVIKSAADEVRHWTGYMGTLIEVHELQKQEDSPG